MTEYQNAVCKGDFQLGSACGKCERCQENRWFRDQDDTVTINMNPMPVLSSSEYECHGLDTQNEVLFYEQDFYILSNFSSFSIMWRNQRFPTVEHAYHYEKFLVSGFMGSVIAGWKEAIRNAPSAHQAFKMGQKHHSWRRRDWDEVKTLVMLELLKAKVEQHEYVERKLIDTGNRTLIENSHRDDFWGWGENKDGKNMLGQLWMNVRELVMMGEVNHMDSTYIARPIAGFDQE